MTCSEANQYRVSGTSSLGGTLYLSCTNHDAYSGLTCVTGCEDPVIRASSEVLDGLEAVVVNGYYPVGTEAQSVLNIVGSTSRRDF